jgi:hypothetical protein
MTLPSNDYEIGYKRPPKASQWQKGQCGNPKRQYGGRAQKGTALLIENLFATGVKILENGKSRTVSVYEAILTQLWLKEMSGNRRAFAVRLKYQEFVTSRRSKRQVIIRDETGL